MGAAELVISELEKQIRELNDKLTVGNYFELIGQIEQKQEQIDKLKLL